MGNIIRKVLIISIFLLFAISSFADIRIEKRTEEVPSGYVTGEYADQWVFNTPSKSYRQTAYADASKLDGCSYVSQVTPSDMYPYPNMTIGLFRCTEADVMILQSNPDLYIFWDEIEMSTLEYCVEATYSDEGVLVSESQVQCP